jgi:pimeloyl-ACP methyl ester carboxylesterase
MNGTKRTGTFLGKYPYSKIGHGLRPLVLVPGLSDPFQGASYSWFTAWTLEHYYRRFRGDYTVYVVSRKRGLSEGYTTRDMADDYAEVIEAIGGPVALYGLSMGGLIAQHVAIDHPELVDDLVIGVSGRHIGEAGRQTIRRWKEWAKHGWWFDIYLDSIPQTYTGYRRWLYPPLIRAVGRYLLSEPAVVSDIGVSAQACLSHDTTNRLNEIDVPTLVIGGTNDHFFPESVVRETAKKIPEARLELFSGAGHGAFEERKRAFDATMKAFLDGQSAGCRMIRE